MAEMKDGDAVAEKSAAAFSIGKEGGQMPRKPKKPCAYPGCPNLTEGRYCPEHQTKVNSEYEKYSRDPRTKKRYGRAWKRIRDKYVMEHPFCERCFERGILVETEEVHHKKPLSEGGTHDRSNLIALCKSCHSRIHADRGDRWGAAGGVKIPEHRFPRERCGGVIHKNGFSNGVLSLQGIEVMGNGQRRDDARRCESRFRQEVQGSD